MDKYTYLTFDQRRKIEKLYNADVRVEKIAAQIGRSVAAVYEELKRGYTGERNANKRFPPVHYSVFKDHIRSIIGITSFRGIITRFLLFKGK